VHAVLDDLGLRNPLEIQAWAPAVGIDDRADLVPALLGDVLLARPVDKTADIRAPVLSLAA